MNAVAAPNASSAAICCAYCSDPFPPGKAWSAFCSAKCRNAYDVEVGATGRVAAVRRIKSGASLVIHLTGPAAERALKLLLGERVRAVRQP